MQGTCFRATGVLTPTSLFAVIDVEVAETVAIFLLWEVRAIDGIMFFYIAVPAGDLGEVLLASIFFPILARLLLSTGNGSGPYSLGLYSELASFFSCFSFYHFFFRSFLTLSEASDWSDLRGSALAGWAVAFSFSA